MVSKYKRGEKELGSKSKNKKKTDDEFLTLIAQDTILLLHCQSTQHAHFEEMDE